MVLFIGKDSNGRSVTSYASGRKHFYSTTRKEIHARTLVVVEAPFENEHSLQLRVAFGTEIFKESFVR